MSLPKINAIMIAVLLSMNLLTLAAVIKQSEQVTRLIGINKELRYIVDLEINEIKGLFYVGRIYE